jgi:hypothetical protein
MAYAWSLVSVKAVFSYLSIAIAEGSGPGHADKLTPGCSKTRPMPKAAKERLGGPVAPSSSSKVEGHFNVYYSCRCVWR